MNQPIAIVGMACRFAGVETLEQLWENLIAQRQPFRTAPPAEDNRAAFVADVQPPTPVDQLLLDVSREAVADSGLSIDSMQAQRVGLFMAQATAEPGTVHRSHSDSSQNGQLQRQQWPLVVELLEQRLRTNVGEEQAAELLDDLRLDFEARFGHRLRAAARSGLVGQLQSSLKLSTGAFANADAQGCSLLMVVNACQQLSAGIIDVAVVGGVRELTDAASQAEMGPAEGEGCGILVLMRQDDAREQQAKVHALIRGYAAVESESEQGLDDAKWAELLESAYDGCDFQVDSPCYFENAAGASSDSWQWLTSLTRERDKHESADGLRVGVINDHWGHTAAAGGVAGVIKATLVMQRQIIPPTPWHSMLRHKQSTVSPQAAPERWPIGKRVRVGVTSLGQDVAAHVVLESPGTRRRLAITPRDSLLSASAQDAELLLFDGHDSQGLQERLAQVAAKVDGVTCAQLADLAVELNHGLGAGAARAACIVRTATEAGQALQQMQTWLADGKTAEWSQELGCGLGVNLPTNRAGLLFSGQAATHTTVGNAWLRRFPTTASWYDQMSDDVASARFGLRPVIDSFVGLELLEVLGIRPTTAIGIGVGEWLAYCWAGVVAEDAVCDWATEWGQLNLESHGGMVVFAGTEDELGELSNELELSPAGSLGEHLRLVAGDRESLMELSKRSQQAGLKCWPFMAPPQFCPLAKSPAEKWHKSLQLDVTPPQATIYSSVSGERLDSETAVADLLKKQMTSPLQLEQARVAAESGLDYWIEVGPGSTLERVDNGDVPIISLDVGGDSLRGLLAAAAMAFTRGGEVRWENLFGDRFTRPFVLARNNNAGQPSPPFNATADELPATARAAQAAEPQPEETSVDQTLGSKADITATPDLTVVETAETPPLPAADVTRTEDASNARETDTVQASDDSSTDDSVAEERELELWARDGTAANELASPSDTESDSEAIGETPSFDLAVGNEQAPDSIVDPPPSDDAVVAEKEIKFVDYADQDPEERQPARLESDSDSKDASPESASNDGSATILEAEVPLSIFDDVEAGGSSIFNDDVEFLEDPASASSIAELQAQQQQLDDSADQVIGLPSMGSPDAIRSTDPDDIDAGDGSTDSGQDKMTVVDLAQALNRATDADVESALQEGELSLADLADQELDAGIPAEPQSNRRVGEETMYDAMAESPFTRLNVEDETGATDASGQPIVIDLEAQMQGQTPPAPVDAPTEQSDERMRIETDVVSPADVDVPVGSVQETDEGLVLGDNEPFDFSDDSLSGVDMIDPEELEEECRALPPHDQVDVADGEPMDRTSIESMKDKTFAEDADKTMIEERPLKETVAVEPPVKSATALPLVIELVSERLDVTEAEIQPHHRAADDLGLAPHLVTTLFADAAGILGFPPPTIPNHLANATLSEIAEVLDQLSEAHDEPGDGMPAVPEVAPLAAVPLPSWRRCFNVRLVRRDAPRCPIPPHAGANWELISPREHPWAERLRQALAKHTNRNGLLVCLPSSISDPGVLPPLSLLMSAAESWRQLNDPEATLVFVQHGGRAGDAFAKSLHLEIPGRATCVIDTLAKDDETVKLIMAEVQSAEGYVEVHFDAEGRRYVPELHATDSIPASWEEVENWDDAESSEIPIIPSPFTSDDVLLLNLSNNRLAAECALHLLSGSKTPLAVVGQTARESDPWLDDYLSKLERANRPHCYVPVEFADDDAVRMAVERIEGRFGRITAIWYSGALPVTQATEHLDRDLFDEIATVPVEGLRALLQAANRSHLRQLVTFSSLSGRTGLARQAASATGYRWLTETTLAHQRQHPNCQCLSLDWSVEEQGSEAFDRECSITPAEAVQWLRELLVSDKNDMAAVIGGRFDEHPTMTPQYVRLPEGRFLQRQRAHVPKVELIVDTTISPSYDNDLLVGEPGALDVAAALEAMTQAARMLVDTSGPVTISDIETGEVLVVNGETQIRTCALVVDQDQVRGCVRASNNGFQSDYFRATFRFGAQPSITQAPLLPDQQLAIDVASEFYAHLPQRSESRQLIQGFQELNSLGCVTQVSAGEGTGKIGVRDAILQSAMACVPGLELRFLKAERCAEFTPYAGNLSVVVQRTGRDNELCFNVEILDCEQRPVESWRNVHFAPTKTRRLNAERNTCVLSAYLEGRCQQLYGARRDLRIQLAQISNGSGTADLLRRIGITNGQPNGTEVVNQADGERNFSLGISGEFGLAIACRSSLVGCQQCSVDPHSEQEWQDLLSAEHLELAKRIAQEPGQTLGVAASLVRNVARLLMKLSVSDSDSLQLGPCFGDGWIVVKCGGLEAVSWCSAPRKATTGRVLSFLVS